MKIKLKVLIEGKLGNSEMQFGKSGKLPGLRSKQNVQCHAPEAR